MHNNEMYKSTIPGIAVGLAYTFVGSNILFIKATMSEEYVCIKANI
jgi:ATP-dependent Lon protease